MAKLLSVVWYNIFPARFGGQKGIAEFSQYLSSYIPLHMICSKNNEATDQPFSIERILPTRKNQFLRASTYRLLDQSITKEDITHLLIEHPYYGWHGIRLAKKHHIPLIIRSHNIEYKRFKEMGKWWWPILFVVEAYAHQKAALNIFMTTADQKWAIKTFGLDATKTMVAPIGTLRPSAPTSHEKQMARAAILTQNNIPENHKILLFNGTLDYLPNALAVQQLVETIVPALSQAKQDFTLLITGRNVYPAFQWVNKLAHPKVKQLGTVKDVELYFKGADLFLNPIHLGGGMKVKVIDALAHDLPVISYASGAIGIDPSVCGHQLKIVPDQDAKAFFQAILQHWDHTENIPSSFFETYHWKGIAKEVAKRIEMLNY